MDSYLFMGEGTHRGVPGRVVVSPSPAQEVLETGSRQAVADESSSQVGTVSAHLLS